MYCVGGFLGVVLEVDGIFLSDLCVRGCERSLKGEP